MRTPTQSLVAFSISSFVLLGACKGDGGGGDPPAVDARPTTDAMGSSPDAQPGAPDAAPDPAAALWQAITGGNDYKNWPGFPGHEGVVASADHGVTHRRAFINETAAADLDGLPDGSILVKENLTSESPTDLAAITVMQKQGDDWYWVRFMPDGSHDVAGTTDDPAAAPCVASGCHGDLARNQDDYVFLNNEAQDAADIYAAITAVSDQYTTWEGFGAGAGTPPIEPDGSGGAHGMYNRAFVNDVANDDEQNLPDDSVLVKENFSANDAAALEGITIMKKIADVDPGNGDWFYVKLGPDGKVQLAGTLTDNAVSCTDSGCHDAAGTGGDFVFSN